MSEIICPRPSFDPKEIAKRAVLSRGSTSQDVEPSERLVDTAVVNEAFENWLQEFAGLWDSPEAMEADAPKVLEKWRRLLLLHASTCQDESTTLEDVARSVFAGRGFIDGGNLLGNPFFDVALATATESGQANAWQTFDATYKETLIAWARRAAEAKLGTLKIKDFDEWYDECKSSMILNGILGRYRGQSGLKPYLSNWVIRCLDERLK